MTWEAKVIAAADADAAAETNWKHKVTPDWGELIMEIHNSIMKIHYSIMDYSIMDLHNLIMDLHNSIMDLHNYGLFMDFHNWYLWISIIRIMDLHS